MYRASASRMVGGAELVHGVHEDGQVIRIDEGLDSVTEIEYVTRPMTEAGQDLADLVANPLW